MKSAALFGMYYLGWVVLIATSTFLTLALYQVTQPMSPSLGAEMIFAKGLLLRFALIAAIAWAYPLALIFILARFLFSSFYSRTSAYLVAFLGGVFVIVSPFPLYLLTFTTWDVWRQLDTYQALALLPPSIFVCLYLAFLVRCRKFS